LAGALIVLFHQFRVGIGPGVWLYTATLVAVSLLLSAVHPGVDNAAHLGGVLAGLTVGWLLVSRRPLGTAAAVVVPSVAIVVLVVWAAAALTSAPGGEPTCLALLF
jgi:membrane associated rhomboid family serine protease